MYQIGFDLVLTNTLLKDTFLKNEMNHDSVNTTWEDDMKEIKQWVGYKHDPNVRTVDENEE